MWFKKDENRYIILKFFVHVHRFLLQGSKKFAILPVSKMNPKFISLDSYSMEGVLRSAGVEDFDVDEMASWDKYFDTAQARGLGKTFTRTIDTDGVSVKIHFQKLKTINGQKKKLDLTGKRMISNDPGRDNILYMVEEISPNVFKDYRLTRQSYYVESGINQAKANSQRWNKSVKKEIDMMSTTSSKEVDLQEFKKFVDAVVYVREAMWREYMKKKWRQQRLRLYGGKKRVFANFFKKLKIDKNTVVAYGSAKFAPGGKNELSVPVSRAFKECSYRAAIVLVDEFRTTKAYWKTGEILKTVATRTKKGALRTVRGLLWCGSTKKQGCEFVNRDQNAAINILRCATLPKRPKIMDRSLAKEKLQVSLGRIIQNKKRKCRAHSAPSRSDQMPRRG